MLHCVVLSSGSKGNCYYFNDGVNGVLIDCGIGPRVIFRKLADLGFDDPPIDAVFISHHHQDHVGKAAALERELHRRREAKARTVGSLYLDHKNTLKQDNGCGEKSLKPQMDEILQSGKLNSKMANLRGLNERLEGSSEFHLRYNQVCKVGNDYTVERMPLDMERFEDNDLKKLIKRKVSLSELIDRDKASNSRLYPSIITSFFCSNGTLYFSSAEALPTRPNIIDHESRIWVGGMCVEAFDLPHDAVGTLGFRIFSQGHWVGVITDLGHVTPAILDKMRTLSWMAFEFNYDRKMLFEGPYADVLKRRIDADFGHLSNEQAEQALMQAASPKLNYLVIAHISENTNAPQTALFHAKRALESIDLDEDVEIYLTEQGQSLSAMTLEPLEELESAVFEHKKPHDFNREISIKKAVETKAERQSPAITVSCS